ncbi:MAG: hypothetical protein KA831_06450 [Pyrinomonadaceae bacterium]|nr:hypothetical protein [Pyrinomonadaceae bacterium]
MKAQKLLVFAAFVFLLSVTEAHAQVKRTITKTEIVDFGPGGTLTVTGAPNGSIRIVGAQTNEVEITATIELEAPNAAGLDKLAGVTTFIAEGSASRVLITSIGTHAKQLLKKSGKKLPKELLGLPFRIDYVIRVPRFIDLEIDGGKGDLTVENVEGSMRINFIESNAKVAIISGSINVTVGKGNVDVAFAAKGWRSRVVNLLVGTGDLNIHLPTNLSAELDAIVLRSGAIDNTFPDLKPRDRKVPFTERAIIAKAGVGGVPLKFSVGDGTLRLDKLALP